MGRNFYFHTTNKELVQKFLAKQSEYGGTYDEEYQIVDRPYLSYRIHLNKLSCGWRPLFQKHIAFSTFKELEKFYKENEGELKIYDEYSIQHAWDNYKEWIMTHNDRERVPQKWVYEIDKRFKDDHPILHTIICDVDEAEIFTPFNHKEQYKRIKNKYLLQNDNNHPSFICYVEAVNNVYNARGNW